MSDDVKYLPVSNEGTSSRRVYRTKTPGVQMIIGPYEYKTVYVASGETLAGGIPAEHHYQTNCKGCGAPWTPTNRCEYCKRYR